MQETYYTSMPSPIGKLVLTSSGESLTGLFMDTGSKRSAGDGMQRDDGRFEEVVAQLDAYFAGDLETFDVALEPHGSPFQLRVWRALRDIPYGQTISYGGLARRVGNAKGARAVGLANGRNPISIIVPCHRVIGANGTLTGYEGGLDRKRHLLTLEAGARVVDVAL
ncbi:methylated-DNA--[protein]-cysteine S-methyltransferase [soil metagenome]